MAKKAFKFKFLPIHFIIVGVFLMLVFSVWRYHEARILSFNTRNVESVKNDNPGVVPVYIKAYPVGVDIRIEPALIVDGVWAIHPDSASFLVNSAKIDQGGNIIIYGHNKDQIMGPIRHIKVGAQITLLGDNDQEYVYEVVKTDTVDPDNLNYLKPTSEETLTLYTCSGFLDTKRFIVVAKRLK